MKEYEEEKEKNKENEEEQKKCSETCIKSSYFTLNSCCI